MEVPLVDQATLDAMVVASGLTSGTKELGRGAVYCSGSVENPIIGSRESAGRYLASLVRSRSELASMNILVERNERVRRSSVRICSLQRVIQ